MNRKFISNSNYVLRKILNNEDCLDITKNLIESILEIKIKEIKLNPYLEKKSQYLPKEENFGIVDVRVITDENEEINIGIQFIDGVYIQTKMLMYYAQIHLNQLEYEETREFARTITINFLDFNYFSSASFQKLIKIKSNEVYVKTEELEFYVIELSKFKLTDITDEKQQWIEYLKGSNGDILKQIKEQNENIKILDKKAEEYWMEEKME